MQPILQKLCPNDRNDITAERLEKGLACEICLPAEELSKITSKQEVIYYLEKSNKLAGDFFEYNLQQKIIEEFTHLSKKLVGELLTAQKNWLLKAISGKSFAITYPTGLGKTTFGILYLLYCSKKDANKRLMFLTPTKALIQQTKEKFIDFSLKAGIKIDIITSADKNREETKNKLISKQFTIAIITPAYLSKNHAIFTKAEMLGSFDVIFVDDVDALLKRSKNIDYLLHLIGFDNEIIREVKEYISKVQRRELDISTKYQEVISKVQDYKKRNKVGQLIFSSATTRVTSSRVKLLKILLNFEPGSTTEVFRKIYDIKVDTNDFLKTTVKIIKTVGSGGIIFVPSDKGSINLEDLKKALDKRKIKSAIVSGKDYSAIYKFKEGKIDVLIGYSRFYGPLVRGLDMPERVKYAIFYGIPKFVLDFKIIEKHPLRALWLAGIVLNLLGDQKERLELLKITNKLRSEVQKYTPEQLRFLTRLTEKIDNIRLFKYTKEVYETLKRIISKEEIVNAMRKRFNIPLVEREGEKYLVFADSLTYLQGSGRTSRMYFAGITTGLSFLLIDDYDAFTSLTNQLKNSIEGFEWMDFKDFEKKEKEIIAIINSEREAIVKKQAISIGRNIQSLKTALLVVESPTKARSIASFFGRPSIRYLDGIPVYECISDRYIFNVIATKGHIFDLISKHEPNSNLYYGVKVPEKNEVYPVYNTIKKCLKCGEQFTEYNEENLVKENDSIFKSARCMHPVVYDSMTVINTLKQLAIENDLVIIATDPDTEGEKIAYDVMLVVSPFANEIKRAELHEITFKAFNDALNNLRTVNKNYVNAQIVRRVGDRWVGYTISNVLQRKYNVRTLGIGRVQAPTLGWVIDAYKKNKRSKKKYFSLLLENTDRRLHVNTEIIKAPKIDRSSVHKIKKEIKNKEVKIEEIKLRTDTLLPPKPLTTSEMLTEGVSKLKISSEKIMRLAQDLFEAGLITYHRTDSYFISELGFQIAFSYLKDNNLSNLYRRRQYSEPGTHECIRPTKPLDRYQLENAIASGSIKIPIQLTQQHYLLYDLIFRYFIASQMKEAKVKRITISFENLRFKLGNEEFNLKLNKIKNIIVECEEDSFVKILPVNVQRKLLELRKGDKFKIIDVQVRKKVKLLLTEDTLIKLMKKNGIGRPSTYSITVQKLKEHRYMFTSPIRKSLIPTKTALRIFNYLKRNYPWIVDVELTRKFEEVMDKIETGKISDVDEELRRFLDEYYYKVLDVYSKKPEITAKIVN